MVIGPEAIEAFCPDGTGCDMVMLARRPSAPNANDGVITINTSAGVSPFQYSIDGGVTFSATNSFSGLMPWEYIWSSLKAQQGFVHLKRR